MRSFISAILLTLVGVSALAAQEPNEAIHETDSPIPAVIEAQT